MTEIRKQLDNRDLPDLILIVLFLRAVKRLFVLIGQSICSDNNVGDPRIRIVSPWEAVLSKDTGVSGGPPTIAGDPMSLSGQKSSKFGRKAQYQSGQKWTKVPFRPNRQSGQDVRKILQHEPQSGQIFGRPQAPGRRPHFSTCLTLRLSEFNSQRSTLRASFL
jgi:hypothetical protein